MRTAHAGFAALNKIPFWAGLDEAVLREVAPLTRVLSVAKGTVVVTQGEPGRGVFFVASGVLAFSRWGEHFGESLVFAVTEPGQMFGERSVIDKSAYSATVTATRDSILFFLASEDAERLFLTLPEVARRVMQHLSALLSHMNTSRASLTQRRAGPRLMDTLLHMATPVEGSATMRYIDALPTQESLAQLSGLKRETVSRWLSQWLREGTVERKGKALFLQVPDQTQL